MKILVVSFFGSWGIGGYVQSALTKLGHESESFYTNSGGDLTERVLNRAKYFKKYFIELWQLEVNKRLIAKIESFNPDIIFVIKGDELLPEFLAEIKNRFNVLLLNWLPDNPFYLGLKNILATIPAYDYVFTFEPANLVDLKKYEKVKAYFLPLACEPQVHKKIALTSQEQKEYGCDICFVGSALPERAKILSGLSDYKLGIWGRGWSSQKYGISRYFKGEASGEKMVKIYNACKIVLNIHAPQTVEGANMRTFEICASGAFQLSDNRASIPGLFEVGKEIVLFNDLAELKKSIDYYLANEQERLGIATNGFNRAVSEHTYLNRMEKIFSLINSK